MTTYWVINTLICFIILFISGLIFLIPIMVIAFWPEDYNIIWKTRRKLVKAGRNDPCPCGSGKKYKKCCIEKFNNAYRVIRWWMPKKNRS